MCWFYMGIAQIALDLHPSVKWADAKKVLKTILASLYTPLLSGNAHCPQQKGASLCQ